MKQENLLQLSAYLADVGDYVSGEELAARFHMTTRTIRNYVAEINASAENMPFILTSRRGYRWNIPADSPLVSRVPSNRILRRRRSEAVTFYASCFTGTMCSLTI